MLLSAQISYPCCGVIVEYKRYVLAKGNGVLIIDRLRNAITKQIITAARPAGAASAETLISLMLQILW